MKKFSNCVAVITGAGSGIGQQLAIQLADAGARLAISDINPDNLQETKTQIENNAATVFAEVVDVSDQKAVFAHAERVKAEFGEVNLVINNAGVALASGPVWRTPLEQFNWVMSINFDGVVSGTYAFLPMLREAQWGHIVNISSLFGLISVPTQSAYNASKFAVRGLTEALRQELKIGESSVSATCVHPGGIKTNIARNARVVDDGSDDLEQRTKESITNFDKLARTTPESAATQILNAVVNDRARLLIGWDAKLIDIVQRIMPSRYGAFIYKMLGDGAPKKSEFQ